MIFQNFIDFVALDFMQLMTINVFNLHMILFDVYAYIP